jgi:hypothetical protein
MRAAIVVGILGVWSVGAVGCGGGSGSQAAPPPATATEFCQQAEAIILDSYVQCYGGKAADWPIFLGPSKCPSLNAAVANHKLTYDATKAAACLDQLAKPVACSADVSLEPSCTTTVLVAGVADGEPCDSSYVCHPGSTCYSGTADDICPVPTCQHSPVAGDKCRDGYDCGFPYQCLGDTCVAGLKLGAPCGNPDQAGCGINLYCATKDPTPTCKRPVENGPCPLGEGCFDYQYCDSTRHCHARVELGGDCSSGPDACGSFTACDPTTHRCVEASHVGQLCGNIVGISILCQNSGCIADADGVGHCVDPAPDGAACTQSYECLDVCTNGKCAPLTPNDGAPCTDATLCATGTCGTDGLCSDTATGCGNSLLCTSGLCANGVCVPKDPNGTDCTIPETCASGLCSSGKCAPPSPSGAACSSGTQCQSGHCAAGKCAACM